MAAGMSKLRLRLLLRVANLLAVEPCTCTLTSVVCVCMCMCVCVCVCVCVFTW